jgi:hypothetical protein
MAKIKTAENVVRALGGVEKVAELCNVTDTAIHNWRAAGVFPARFYHLMTSTLRRRGRTAPAALWQQAEPNRAA